MTQTPPRPALAAPVRAYFDNAPEARRLAMQVLRKRETEPSVLGAGAHLLVVAHRPR